MRRQRESAIWREAPHGLPSSRLVSTIPFDFWMGRAYPHCPFARYADDAVVHCRSQKQAEVVMRSIALRLEECGLTMHP